MTAFRPRPGPAPDDSSERLSPADLGSLVLRVQAQLLSDYPDLVSPVPDAGGGGRASLKAAIKTILASNRWGVAGLGREILAARLADEVSGYGPITPLLHDDEVNEVMVNGPGSVYIERQGRLEHTRVTFRDEEHLMAVIARIVAPLGRRVDRTSPHVDGRLPDGSRIHVILPPLSLQGPVLTIRKFRRRRFTLEDLVGVGTFSQEAAAFLELAVSARLNAVIAGGAGAGKTTTLNAMASLLERTDDRIITMEDAAEIKLTGLHVVSLETRPPNLEGRGEVTMRQLLRNALRMRPDRLIIGEVRGEEAFDLLQALNTGHDGCLSTVHSSGAGDALRRIENMVLTAGHRMDLSAVSRQLRSALDLVVYQTRLPGGRRVIGDVSLVRGGERGGLWPVFRLNRGEPAVCTPVGRGLPGWLLDRLDGMGVGIPQELAAAVGQDDRGVTGGGA